ncbi:hypothetical protein QJ527_07225 [Enterococcus mundtii]|uniref:DUF1056 domain-containing protein n=1 Tax=Enterococcus mundtii TaxID=53346 RepID=A0A848MXW5_ENTMU|nr:hypothetical protein [Enterococcus mundtii]EYT95538.1 hypothetical protein AK89_07470 [Enterococcus mundtii CRL35]MCA6775063.1 hypothetical protein [Enterococcus mundtii]MDK4211333.1 hypothetical protein [Enterococcus mundtii]MDV7743648.1 hypothetical protein [Enterococcus mundtii]NMP58601.1 hypothetical protein [Enterococcus mundtii]
MIKFFNVLLTNIHTILLIVGIAFIAVAAFLYSAIVGWLTLGVCFVFTSILIDKRLG